MCDFAKIGAATTTANSNSVTSALVGTFVDMLQVPQGKIMVILGGCVNGPSGITPFSAAVAICDPTQSFGAGPSLDLSGKINPLTIGIWLSTLAIEPSNSVPFNDDFAISAPPIAVPSGFFIRVVGTINGVPGTQPFSVTVLYALIDAPC